MTWLELVPALPIVVSCKTGPSGDGDVRHTLAPMAARLMQIYNSLMAAWTDRRALAAG
jgi:hypothetical protein